MSGGFFRGTSADQDTRFSNKQAKLMKSQKFAPELDHLVDMSKVKMDVVKPWIATRVTEVLGFEDEVLINFIYGLLDGKEINGKEVQIQITGFMEKNTGKFMKELWNLLLSAQKNASGVPQQFLDAKEEEIRKKKAESDLITQEIQRKKEIEQEKQKKMDEEFASKAVDDASDPVSKYSTAQPDDDKVSGGRNGSRRKNRSPRSPRSSERPASPRQITRSGSISKSFSNSRSYSEDSHKSRSRSLSSQSRGRSVSPDRRYVSPRKRLSPRRKYSPRRPRSPLRWRSPYSRRRRSPTPRRRRSPSPMLRSSPSLRRRRSPPAMRRRRSPTPVRRRSPSPVRRRSSPPMRRRSPTLRHKSPSPVRSGSPLVTRRRSPTVSPPARRRSPSSPARLRSPSSPARRRSPSPPLRRRSPSPPARRRSPSPPARRRSPSPPARRRAPSSPARRRSPSPPTRRRSPSPPARRRPPSSPLTRRRSPSPVRRRSPRQRRRSPLRLPTQKYRGGSPYRRRSPAYQRHRSLSRDHDVRNNGAGSRRTGGRSSPLIPGEGEVEDSGVDSASRHPPISMRSPQRDRTNQSDAGRIVPAHLSSREVSPSHSGSSMHTGKSSASEEQRNMEAYASSASPVRQTSVDDSRRTVRESRAHLSRVDEGRRTSPQRRVGHSHKEGAHRSIPTKDSKDEEYSPERLSAHQLGDEERSVDDIEIKRKERDNKSEKASLRIDSLTPNKTAPQPAEYSPGRVEVKEFTSVNAGDEHKSFPRDDNNVDEKSHSHLRDVVGSGIDSEDERKSKGLERKKHKRHDRHHTASEDDSGYDSRIDERKDAKRRRKEEKKLRKEEKRRRREERHRKKEERRAGKLKAKAVDTDKHMSDADDSDDHVAVTEERETEQKKLEIELRKKALESLRAKKAITPSDI